MFISIGQNFLVQKKNILGIFDIENTTEDKITKEFLSSAQKRGQVEYVTEDLPRSFILYEEYGRIKVYITSFSTVTLKKRFQMKNEME